MTELSPFMNRGLGLVRGTGYNNGQGSTVHIGLAFEGASEWVRPDGLPVVFLKWWPTVVTDDSIDGRSPFGVLMTTRRYTGYMTVIPASAKFPFVCQVQGTVEGKK